MKSACPRCERSLEVGEVAARYSYAPCPDGGCAAPLVVIASEWPAVGDHVSYEVRYLPDVVQRLRGGPPLAFGEAMRRRLLLAFLVAAIAGAITPWIVPSGARGFGPVLVSVIAVIIAFLMVWPVFAWMEQRRDRRRRGEFAAWLEGLPQREARAELTVA